MLKLDELMDKYNTFWFDLDQTVWITTDKHNQIIWAKQMIEPFEPIKIIGTNDIFVIKDDVGNENCIFRGVREVWQELRKNNKIINVVSCGARYKSLDQPSEKLLKMWELTPDRLFLAYKTFRKVELLKEENEPFVLFDDDHDQLAEVGMLENACCIHISSMFRWQDLL